MEYGLWIHFQSPDRHKNINCSSVQMYVINNYNTSILIIYIMILQLVSTVS